MGDNIFDEQKCRVCGCTWNNACEDGAWHITNSISTSELFNYDGGAIKVIGNIFENPELLNM